MSDAIGAEDAGILGNVPDFLGGFVSNVYTASGTMAASDRVSVFNSPTAIAITVPPGYRDGQPHILKNLGAGAVTLTLTIDGTASTSTNLARRRTI